MELEGRLLGLSTDSWAHFYGSHSAKGIVLDQTLALGCLGMHDAALLMGSATSAGGDKDCIPHILQQSHPNTRFSHTPFVSGLWWASFISSV